MSEELNVREAEPLKEGGAAWIKVIVLIAVLQLGLGLVYLENVPRLYNDESWEASVGYTLAYEGKFRTEAMIGCGGMHIRLLQNRLVMASVCAAIYKVAGFSITTSRLGSVLFGVISICGTCIIMRRWFGLKQASLVGLALLLHPWFFEISRRARPEIYYLGLALVGLAFLIHAINNNKRPAAVFAGVFAGLTCLTHPSGCVLIAAIAGGVFLWLWTPAVLRLLGWMALGFMVPIIPYVIYILLPIDNQEVSLFAQMHACADYFVQTGWRSWISGEKLRWARFFVWPKGAPLAAITFVAWAVAWYRSTREDKAIATIVALFAIAMPVTSINRTARYLIVITPFLSALVVRLFVRIMPSSKSPMKKGYKPRVAVALSVAAIYISMNSGAIGLLLYRQHDADLMRALDRIAAVTGPDDRVYGRTLFWFGRDMFRFGPYLEAYDVEESVDLIREARFDYAIRSAWTFATSGGISIPPQSMPGIRNDAVDQVCARFGTKVDAFRDPFYGPIEIYKLDWKDSPDKSPKSAPAAP